MVGQCRGRSVRSPTRRGSGQSAGHHQRLRRSTVRQLAESGKSPRGRSLVFTNGCFDLLHVGHITLLEKSRREGDALFVGVNTDKSVRRLKGPSRPIQPEWDRARIVAAQGCVDAVLLFEEDTPYDLI